MQVASISRIPQTVTLHQGLQTDDTREDSPSRGYRGRMLVHPWGSYAWSYCQESSADLWKTRFRPIFAKRHPPPFGAALSSWFMIRWRNNDGPKVQRSWKWNKTKWLPSRTSAISCGYSVT